MSLNPLMKWERVAAPAQSLVQGEGVEGMVAGQSLPSKMTLLT
jgi:hypothetical protein